MMSKPLTAKQSVVARKMPQPVNILWYLLIKKGIITKKELTEMAFNLSGMTEVEFKENLKILEGE